VKYWFVLYAFSLNKVIISLDVIVYSYVTVLVIMVVNFKGLGGSFIYGYIATT
jgi:hypothetical protein